jgi:hypothetical protein
MFVFLQGSVMAVEFLILNGAKINAQDADGKTLLLITTVLGEIYILFGFKSMLLLLLCLASGCYNSALSMVKIFGTSHCSLFVCHLKGMWCISQNPHSWCGHCG